MATTGGRESEWNSEYEDDPELTPKQRYRRVCQAVTALTEGADGPEGRRAGVPPGVVIGHVTSWGHGDREFDDEALRSALQRAVSNGDLVRWRDDDGVERVSRTDMAGVTKIASEQNARDDPSVELIEAARSRLDEGVETDALDRGLLGIARRDAETGEWTVEYDAERDERGGQV